MHSQSRNHRKVATQLKKFLHLRECEKKGLLHSGAAAVLNQEKLNNLVLIGGGSLV